MEVDDGIFRSGLIVGGLSDSGKIGTGFHFDGGKIIFGVFVDESLVLEKSAKNGNGFLVGKNRTLEGPTDSFAVLAGKEKRIETIIKKISVLGVFVKNGFGNVNVADFAV